MRIQGATFQKLLLGAALLPALAWNLAQASEIKGLTVSAGATGTRAEIALDQPGKYTVIRLAQPDRLVVDFAASRLPSAVSLPAGAGIVRSVRSGQPTPGVARLVFDLSQPVAVIGPRLEQSATGPRLILEWPGEFPSAADVASASVPAPAALPADASATRPPSGGAPAGATAPSTTPAETSAASSAATSRLISTLAHRGDLTSAASQAPAAAPAVSVTRPVSTAPSAPRPAAVGSVDSTPDRSVTATVPPSNVPVPALAPAQPFPDPARARGMRPLVIAIDPGHGGQDPGAIGQGGKREKDVTLSIARELARQINATPGLKAYLTRDSDMFIPLNRRAQLARQARADMFVSIHADAAENRSANGSSVYVLSLKGASSQRARWLADKENASDLVGGVRLEASSTLTSVLLDLTQSGQMKASEEAAAQVLTGLGRIGRNHKPHVERANFAVLRTSDMPAMLVETAFISNPDEERRLNDPAYQRQLARAVLEGVNAYFLRQPPPGTLYAARAANQPPANPGAGGGSP